MRIGRRGTYFYVIDALIGSIILITTILITTSTFTVSRPSTVTFYTGEDMLSSADTTHMGDLDNETARVWLANGTADPKLTLLQQLALFEVTGNAAGYNNLSGIIGRSAPRQVNAELLVNGNQRYISNVTPKESAETMISTKHFVLLRRNPSDLYPPVVVEVRSWQ